MQTYSSPTGDFVTSTLNGAFTAGSTSGTIGSGLSIPATNGILEIDYDSILAVGVNGGPETILYATYNSGTGALTGITRGLAGTTGVTHNNGASVANSASSLYIADLYAGKLAQNAILADVLATNAIKLGIATASGQSGVTTAVDVTGCSVTVTIPAGGRSVLVMAVGSASSNNAAGLTSFDIQAAGSNITGGNFRVTHNNATNSFTGMGFAVETPAAGSRTYKLRATGVVGTTTIDATTNLAVLVI